MPSLDSILLLLEYYKYWIILPLAIVEGPIVAIIGGFLTTLGYLNVVALYFIAVLGDQIGDTICYSFGRWGNNFLRKYGIHIGITEARIHQAESYFAARQRRAIVLSKIIHGIGVTGLIAAGALHIPFFRFIRTCLAVTLVQYALAIGVGILFGESYLQIGRYLDYFAATISIVVIAGIAFLIYRQSKVSS